jgi:[protein-PII] uridylyltransferase
MSLDTFYVLDSSGAPIEDPERLRYIRDYLERNLGPQSAEPGIVPRLTPRRVRSFRVATQTSMSRDDARNLSVLEVASLDRPGLLARIGEVFTEYGVMLQAAKIQTLGERVEDVFFVTDTQRQPIDDPELAEQIQAAIRDRLDAQEAA